MLFALEASQLETQQNFANYYCALHKLEQVAFIKYKNASDTLFSEHFIIE